MASCIHRRTLVGERVQYERLMTLRGEVSTPRQSFDVASFLNDLVVEDREQSFQLLK